MADPRIRGTRTRLKITLDAELVEGESTCYTGDAAVLAWAQGFAAALGQGRVVSAVVVRGTNRAVVDLDEITAKWGAVAEILEPDDLVTRYEYV